MLQSNDVCALGLQEASKLDVCSNYELQGQDQIFRMFIQRNCLSLQSLD
jgi:hypothetical protein